MGEHVVSRSAMRVDDPFGIPACFYWTVDEVADWVDSIGYGKYKENFRSHFINGRKLLTVDSCVLPKMGITHFGDILAVSGMIRDVIGKNPTTMVSPGGAQTTPQHQATLPVQQRVAGCQANKADVNSADWRHWVAGYYYGYTPKEAPVTYEKFMQRYDPAWKGCGGFGQRGHCSTYCGYYCN